MRKKTAILIFANSAKAEGYNKPSLHYHGLFEALNTEIESKVKRTKAPYFIVSEAEQKGHDFGTRFTNAIQDVFNKGFENIITVGNDTPHLKTAHIIDAIEKLNENALVLGPSQDGGFYLIGINKALFNTQQFKQLPWQTSLLNRTILKSLSLKNFTITWLETLHDIDEVLDVAIVLNSFKKLSVLIKKLLLAISYSAKALITLLLFLPLLVYKSNKYNKGSPQLFSI